MSENYFKIPIAVLKSTNRIVNVTNVPNGIECNCYCPICKGDLVAVNREIKQKAHFRHSSAANCNIKGESYIHWLTKEVFKTIKQFNVPPITAWNLYEDSDIFKKFIKELEDYFKNYNVSAVMPPPVAFINPKCVLQSDSEIQIEACRTEVQYDTPYGVAQIDVVGSIGGKPIFIEPFFTNRIKTEKLRKLVYLDISVLEVNLVTFIHRKGWMFTIEDFKRFLINETETKAWVFIRKSKMERLIQTYMLKMHDKLKAIQLIHQENLKVQSQMQEVASRIADLQREQMKLGKKIQDIDISNIFS